MPEPSLGLRAEVRQENGRWVVYLCSVFWAADLDTPLQTVVRRIKDYSTKREAEVAARWMERCADRNSA